jgi:hypothetical protein
VHLFPWWKEAFSRWTGRYGEGFFFSRYTILWLLRQALTTCAAQGGRRTHEACGVFGEACLIANDLANPPKTTRTSLELAASLLPTVPDFSQEEFDVDVARSLYLLAEDARRVVPSLPGRIEGLLGYTIEEYCDLAFASAMKPIAEGPTNLATFELAALTPAHFRTTNIRPERAQVFLQSISATETTLANTIAQEKAPERSLMIFRTTPLLDHNDAFVPIDIGFVLDKAGRGLFWAALKQSTDIKEQNQLLSDWGTLHEHHLNTLLAENLGRRSKLLVKPSFANGDEAFDSAILEGRTLIAIECKATTMRDDIKYVDDPVALRGALEQRFVTGEGKKRKGLAQLSKNIQRFAMGEVLHDATEITLSRAHVGTVVPVLVHVDNTLRTPGIPHYLNFRFKEQARIKRPIVTPLVLLPLTELEQLEGHLTDHGLMPFVESFLEQLKADPAAVFFTGKLPLLRDQPRKRGTSLQRLDKYLDTLLHRLFPNAPIDADEQPDPERRAPRADTPPMRSGELRYTS